MYHTEFNKRFEAYQHAVEHTPKTEVTEALKQAWAQEAYLLLQELPPACDRAQYLTRGLKWLKSEGFTPKVIAATDSAAVKKLVNRDPRQPVTHHATRGRTVKATPKALAEGKVAALTAQVDAYTEALKEALEQVERVTQDLIQAEQRLLAARKALKGFRGGRKATETAPSAPAARQAKATPKGELSFAMQEVLKFIKTGEGLAHAGLTLKQVSVNRMHLVMRGLVAKQADGTYTLTPAGKTALKSLK